MNKSIRNWLITPLIGLFVVPFILLGAFFAWQNYVVEKEHALSLQKKFTEIAADNIAFYLHEQEIKILFMLRKNFLPDLSPAEQHQLFSRFLAASKDENHEHGVTFRELILLDKTGRQTVRVSMTRPTSSADLVDQSDSDEFLNAAGMDGIYYSPVYFSEKTGEPLLKLSVALRDLRTLELQGVLVAEMNFRFLWNLVADIKIGKRGLVYITDQKGQVLAHPNRSVVLKKTFIEVPGVPAIMKGISGQKVLIAAQGVDFGSRTLFLVTENPASEALKHIRRSILIIGAFILFMLWGAVVLGLIIINQIIKPIEKLAVIARRISAGDFTQQAEAKRMDELGDLSVAFNMMTARLLENIKALESEKNFVRSAIDSLTHPFYVIDIADYRIKLANSASGFGALTGDKTCYQLTHQEDKPCDGVQHPCTIKEIREHGEPVVVQHVHVMDDGSKRVFDVYGYPIFDDQGNVSRVIEYNIDVTDKKNLEEQLIQSQKLEAIGILAGGVAHDFNNILTTIIGYSELILLELPLEHPLRERLEIIHDSGNKASALTRQLLAFSRKQIMEMQVVNLNDLIRNVIKMLGRLIGEDIEIKLLLQPGIGNIQADPGQIEQIIMNLAINSKDAMRDGGNLFFETNTIELDEEYCRTHVELSPGPYVMLSVTDTGQGLSPEIKERIFDPFFTTKEKGAGTGLGLAMVYGIIKQLKGHIFVYSELGSGTTFKIYFPEVFEQAADLPDTVAKDKRLKRGTETVLVVDDEPSIRNLIADTLRPLGYEVIEAGSGDQALEAVKDLRGKIDLLMTDVVMPGMSCRALADHMEKTYPGINVLFMSGYTDNVIAHKGVLKPGIYFINKPLVPTLLSRKIRQILDAVK